MQICTKKGPTELHLPHQVDSDTSDQLSITGFYLNTVPSTLVGSNVPIYIHTVCFPHKIIICKYDLLQV